MKPIEITTPRLTLKPFDYKDIEVFVKYQQDEEFKRQMGGVLNEELAREKFDLYYDFFAKNSYGFFSIYEKGQEEWIGQAGISTRATADFVELGWAIVPKHQGKGYATEAIRAVIDWCRKVHNWQKFYFCIEPENIPSVKLAEKLGGKNIGTHKLPQLFKGHNIEVWELDYNA